ncbi:MAG: epoxyqueuosine reductase [Spirochaetia bacterium]
MPGLRCEQGRLREDRGLSISPFDAQRISDLALEAGFSRAGFTRGVDQASVLVCCLSCHRSEIDDLSTADDPHGLIAPFARRNYYKTAVRMLRRLTARLDVELGIPRKSVRIFCNSRLPEKPLCVAAGLAWQGNNGLCITSGLGSLFVIAGAVIPASLSGFADPTPSPTHCGSCRRCIEACPTRAIRSPGIVDRSLCLQGLAASADALPPDVMEKWGARLYGCQVCQSVCPHNSGPLEEAPAADGEVGPSVSLRWFLSQDAPSLQRLFHGTTMGLSWISKEALLRNAIVAAGNSRYGGLRESVEPFVGNASPALNAAARWALERI